LKAYQDGQTEGHLGWYIKEFQDPNNGDSIMKIQKELNETKETLQKAIQSTLERGECANGRIGTNGARRNLESEANGESYFRRETRQPCRKVRQLERFEQDVLHSSEEAELVLRGHVNYGAAGAYELNGFARSICAASGWVEQRLFSPQETLKTFQLGLL
jgi:hypothetical protein